MSTETLDNPALATAEQAPTPTLPGRPLAPELAHWLPIDDVRPSTYNPRKRFDPAALERLADLIARQGVLQPIVTRAVQPARPGGATKEIVAGERRWRACKILMERGGTGPHVIPGFVRELDDFQAREVALTENGERNDLHPLEEAQGFEDLLLRPVGGGEFKPPRLRGYTVEELADKLGRKPNYVFGRLKLLQLIPEAREACLDDKLKVKIAEALARYPEAVQREALPELLRGWGGEPFSHRQAMEHLRNRYMLKLGKAVFPIEDAKLLPKAGACTDCPKRSANSPELFAEFVAKDDMCLDATCHQAKVKAWSARQLGEARKSGSTVLEGKAAQAVLGHYSATSDYALRSTGHVDLDRPAEELTGNRKPLRALLGKDFDGAVIVKGAGDQKPHTVAKEADVKAALREKGLLKPSHKPRPGEAIKQVTPEDIERQREYRINDMLDERMPTALAKHLQSDGAEGFPASSDAWLRFLFDILHDAGGIDSAAVCKAVNGHSQIEGWIDELVGEKLVRAVLIAGLQVALGDERHNLNSEEDDRADALAGAVGFDLVALRKQVADEVDAAIRDEVQALSDAMAPAAKKSEGARKVPGKAKPAAGSAVAEQTPEKALAEAVKEERKAKAGAKLPKALPPQQGADAGSEAQGAPRAATTVSDEAAWPFPGTQP